MTYSVAVTTSSPKLFDCGTKKTVRLLLQAFRHFLCLPMGTVEMISFSNIAGR